MVEETAMRAQGDPVVSGTAIHQDDVAVEVAPFDFEQVVARLTVEHVAAAMPVNHNVGPITAIIGDAVAI